jgi:hypothetical protein
MVSGGGGGLLKTRQTTAYHVGDDGDLETGLPASYSVLTTGQFSGTTAIDTPHYAAAGISFVAPSTINDAGAGFVTFLATDTIRVIGSGLNDGVYTVAVGGVAAQIVVNEATIVNEGAGAYVTICKRSSPSNNAVIDNVTGLMWKRYTTGGPVERVGIASTGTLNWYDTATCFTLHPAAADLQMMTTGIKIVGGAGEIARYFVGAIIDPSGFANAVNNLPGYRVTSVAVNGADLDILLWTGRNTLIAEAAAGARDIRVVCRSIYAYCAGANAASFGGFTNWRIPNQNEMVTLFVLEGASAVPNAVAFPSWPVDYVWEANTRPSSAGNAMYTGFPTGVITVDTKTAPHMCELVRG